MLELRGLQHMILKTFFDKLKSVLMHNLEHAPKTPPRK